MGLPNANYTSVPLCLEEVRQGRHDRRIFSSEFGDLLHALGRPAIREEGGRSSLTSLLQELLIGASGFGVVGVGAFEVEGEGAERALLVAGTEEEIA
jgi:hypothetical protein